MELDIKGYSIREWKLEDIESLTKYANNPKIAANLRDGFPHPYTLSDAELFLNKVISESPQTILAIANQTEIIGSIGLMLGQDVHRFTAELGYWIAEPFWGKGIMTSAIKAITNFGFKELGLKRICAMPYASNPASAKILEKAGFSLEGTLRANVVKYGKVLDQYMYAKVDI
jgi:ribosomal-protein-alanine N-acetyltransferase